MDLAEVTYPGVFLEPSGEDWPHNAHSQLRKMETHLIDASLALWQYKQAKLSTEGAEIYPQEMPSNYRRRLPFIHARTFLFACDGVAKSIHQLRKELPVAQQQLVDDLRSLESDLKRDLPDAIDLRDSAHHEEERVVGKAFNKKIDLSKPVETSLIDAPHGGVMMIDCLINDAVTATVADGRIASLDVTAQTLAILVDTVQRAINLFSWRGPQMSSSQK